MYKERDVKCPECGKEGLPRLWLGIDPPICNQCGYQAKKPKIIC